MGRQMNIPPQYSARVGGDGVNWITITVDVDSDFMAARKLVDYGIPFAAANSFSAQPFEGSTREGILSLETINPRTGRSLVTQATGANLGSGATRRFVDENSDILNILGQTIISGSEERLLNPNSQGEEVSTLGAAGGQFTPGGFGESSLTGSQRLEILRNRANAAGVTMEDIYSGNVDPAILRTIFLQTEGGDENFVPGTTDFKPGGPTGSFSGLPTILSGIGSSGDNGANFIDINDLLASFTDDELFYTDPETGIEVLNPLVEQLLLIADSQGNQISQQQIADIKARSAVEIAQFNKDAAVESARLRGESDKEIARISATADENIANAQAQAQRDVATTQAGATTGAAQAAAGAASPFGFIQQGGTTEQLANIYESINEVGLAEAAAAESQAAAAESQAQAARLAAQGNIFSFAAGQEQFDPNQLAQIAANSPEAFAARAQVDAATAQADAQRDIARIQSSVGLDQNQKDYLIAQVNSDAQRAVAAIQSAAQQAVAASQAAGQIGAARAGASGFGALLSGDTAVNQQANAILRAQQANNPYAAAQLGDVEQSRIDQILRGGLTAEQRLAEIRASQEAQNFANQLNFISSPSAVGFASERGLLQDISDSPEGNIPGSLFGFNAPSAAGAGGGQTTNVGNYNLNTLRNVSDEQLGFLQGAAAAEGMTPSEFEAQAQAFTPQGV